MTATQYFDSPKLQLKKFTFKHTPNTVEKECHRLNYTIVTLITRDIVDTLSAYSKEKLISSKDMVYFEKLANQDNDYLFDLYKKRGRLDDACDDFSTVSELFSKFADLSLSEYQKGSAPLLKEILSVIYGLHYIQTVIPMLCSTIGRVPDANVARIIKEKKSEMEKLFMAEFKEVSNQKTFDFGQLDSTFKKMEKMSRNEYLEFLDNL